MRNKVVTIVIVIATVLLAGVAIFTAVRLYQLREESVAPTAPESVPEAAVTEPEAIPEACEPLTFTITERAPGLACIAKSAYKDDARNEPGSYYLVSRITSGTELDPGDVFLYALSYENTGTATVTNATFTDTLPPQLEYVDADPNCSETSGVVTCTTGEVVPGGKSQKTFRVKVASGASSGNFTNTATLDPVEGDSSTCSITLAVSQPASPTPTPKTTASPSPTPKTTPSPTPSGTPGPTTSATPTSIAQATPAPSTPAPSLPDAGIPTPTLVGLAAGSLLLLLAILALAL